MRFLIPIFDTGFLYEVGPVFLMLFFVVMVIRVFSRSRREHYREMSELVLKDNE